jgi:hypothetical protein
MYIKSVGIRITNLFTGYSWQVRGRDSSFIERWPTGWMIGGSSLGRGWEFFSSLPVPPSLLSSGYQGLFPRG